MDVRKSTREDTIILSCSSLAIPLDAAQKKMGTDFDVRYLQKELHADPCKMRTHIIEELEKLPEEINTVLVAMGYCGGSWKNIESSKRIVMAYVDDCVSLLLCRDGDRVFDRKSPGHIYIKDQYPESSSIERIFNRLVESKDLSPERANKYRKDWQEIYSNVDIVDAGLWDVREKKYVEAAQADADFLKADLGYVKGSNILLEKLVAGDWDKQFIIIEPGEGFPIAL